MEHAILITMNDIEPRIAPQLREYAERRLAFSLRRFQQHIRNVRVRLVDLNGPKRGIDARCSVIAELTNGRQLFVEATTAWPFSSIRSEEHTSELQSQSNLVCHLLLEKKKQPSTPIH